MHKYGQLCCKIAIYPTFMALFPHFVGKTALFMPYLVVLCVQVASDSNKRSIGIHYFKVLVQIHYSQGPSLGLLEREIRIRAPEISLFPLYSTNSAVFIHIYLVNKPFSL